ncbi:hypothetical protein [Acidithiobacillus sulfuriphilus]|uniref:hypothetical protein n=1 Tax=Acidithiobacillus sulfuriphilus TaxID=1867749 RepID=UPI003F5F0127
MENCKRTVIRGPLALFLGSVPGRRLEVDGSRSSEEWMRFTQEAADGDMCAIEVCLADGRRVTVVPDIDPERVHSEAMRTANDHQRDVDVYVDGEWWYRVSPSSAPSHEDPRAAGLAENGGNSRHEAGKSHFLRIFG